MSGYFYNWYFLLQKCHISYFVTNAALTNNHYRTYIISGIGHSRSDSVGLLVLWTTMYNIQGVGVLLQVPRDNTNPVENG